MKQISPQTNSDNADHVYWHGYWTGPVGWLGLRVLANQARLCPKPYGNDTNCRATVLCSQNTVLTAENVSGRRPHGMGRQRAGVCAFHV